MKAVSSRSTGGRDVKAGFFTAQGVLAGEGTKATAKFRKKRHVPEISILTE